MQRGYVILVAVLRLQRVEMIVQMMECGVDYCKLNENRNDKTSTASQHLVQLVTKSGLMEKCRAKKW